MFAGGFDDRCFARCTENIRRRILVQDRSPGSSAITTRSLTICSYTSTVPHPFAFLLAKGWETTIHKVRNHAVRELEGRDIFFALLRSVCSDIRTLEMIGVICGRSILQGQKRGRYSRHY